LAIKRSNKHLSAERRVSFDILGPSFAGVGESVRLTKTELLTGWMGLRLSRRRAIKVSVVFDTVGNDFVRAANTAYPRWFNKYTVQMFCRHLLIFVMQFAQLPIDFPDLKLLFKIRGES
jgi:hypothetical protein